MKQIKLPLLFAAFFMLNFPVQAQSLEQLNNLDKKYQTCLDKGMYMVACSQDYYTKMDKLLNLAYNKVQSSLDPSQKAALKEEQVKWHAERDAYFRKIDNEYSAETGNGSTGNDKRMIGLDKKAQYVRKRVGELMKNMGKS